MGYDAAASTSGCVLFRDGNDIEPPEESYEDTEGTFDNPYIPDAEVERAGLPMANFRAMREDEWLPDPNDTGEDLNEVEEEKKPTLCDIAKAKFVAAQPKILNAIDSGGVMIVFMAMTFWALLAEDIKTALESSNESAAAPPTPGGRGRGRSPLPSPLPAAHQPSLPLPAPLKVSPAAPRPLLWGGVQVGHQFRLGVVCGHDDLRRRADRAQFVPAELPARRVGLPLHPAARLLLHPRRDRHWHDGL